MLDNTPAAPSILSLALDIVDKLIKLAAVLIGGAWTFWNFKKSRTYVKKLELGLTGNVFVREGLFIEINAVIKNLGATQHIIQQEGTFCEILAIDHNLLETALYLFPVFTRDDRMEPSESVNDILCWRIAPPFEQIVWIKLRMRVVSGDVEWWVSSLIKVEEIKADPLGER